MARWNVDKDGTARHDTGSNVDDGNGTGQHLQAGYYPDKRYQSFLSAQIVIPNGAYQHTKTTLWLKTNSSAIPIASNPYILVMAISGSWLAGSGGPWDDHNALKWDNKPDVRTGIRRVKKVPESNATVFGIDVTDIIDTVLPDTILDSEGNPGAGNTWYGVRIAACDAQGTLSDSVGDGPYAFEVSSSEGGYVPWFEATFDLNQPPNAPNNVTPAADSVADSPTGDTLTVGATFSDPNAGDSIAKSEVEVWSSGAVDPSTPGGPVTGGTLITNSILTKSLSTFSHKVTGLPTRTALRYRIHTLDDAAKPHWGAWTELRDVTTAFTPNAPQNVFVDSTTLTPTAAASLSSADPADFATAMQWLVFDDSLPGSQPIFDSGKVDVSSGSPVRPILTYAGNSTLVEGVQYRHRVFLWNRDDVISPTTGDLHFTIHLPTGPAISPNSTSTRQTDPTPTFTLTFGAAVDQYQFEMYAIPGEPRQIVQDVPDDAALAYSVPPTVVASSTTVNVTPTVAMPWGSVIHVRGAGRPTGGTTMGPWSPLYPIYIAALPNAPAVTLSGNGGAGVVQEDSDLVVVPLVSGTTLVINAPFDSDDVRTYGDVATAKTTEVRVAAVPIGSGSHVTSSPKVITSGITASENWTTGLTIEQSYDVGVKYKNATGTYGPTTWRTGKISRPPVVTDTAPVDDATVLDPTPLLDWAFSSAGGKAQKRKRIRIYRQIPTTTTTGGT